MPTGTFFYVFTGFFQNPKKNDFLRFFELPHTFSRTLLPTSKSHVLSPSQSPSPKK